MLHITVMDDQTRISISPTADRRPLTQTRHGETMVDDYAWLRDADWQAVMRDPVKLTPDIRAHLEAENAYSASVMADTIELQKT
jgi:oligopeptidase B